MTNLEREFTRGMAPEPPTHKGDTLEDAVRAAQSRADGRQLAYFIYKQGGRYRIAEENRSWFGQFICKIAPRISTVTPAGRVWEPAQVGRDT